MGRAPCCEKNGLKKGPWTTEEDFKLTRFIEEHGPGNWRTLPKNAGLQRCGKSCRLRWTNYLRPDIKRGRFSFEEEETIIQLHSVLGNKWSAIAARLPGRTDNEIKNYWNTHIRKRLLRMGLDPVTHTPKYDGSSSQLNILSNLLLALNQQQQLVNPQLLSIVASLLTLNQQSPQSQVLFGNDNVSEDRTNWQQHQSNSPVDDTPLVCQPFDQPQLDAMEPMNAVEGFLSGEMGGYSFEVAGDDQRVILEETNGDQQFTFNSPLTTSTSSPLNSSSWTNNGVNNDDCTSLFNFEIPQGFDMSEYLLPHDLFPFR